MKLLHNCTYWEKESLDGYGNIVYRSPRVINVRWEDKQLLFINKAGNQLLSQAIVYSNINIVDESYLYLGTTRSVINPLTLKYAFKVKAVSKITNLNNTNMVVKVWL